MGPASSPRPGGAARAAALAVVATFLLAAGCTSNDTVATGASSTLPSASSGGPSSSERPTTTKKGKTTTTEESTDETTDETTTETTDDPTTTEKSETTELAGRGPDEIDACELLPEEDVVDAIGDPVTPGEDQSHDECWWYGPNDLKTVNLIRRTGEDLDTWRSGYDNDSWEPVDRGDEGYQGKVLDSIVWRIDDTVFEVNVNYSTKGDPEQAVTDLADAVQAHLGR